MNSQTYKIYGIFGVDDIKSIARKISDEYSLGANKEALYKLLTEIAVVETNAGRAVMDINRNYGRSIMQFDKVGYNEALRQRARVNNRDFESEVKQGYMSDTLQKNPAFAMYLARMYFLKVNRAIPNDLNGRANYWKTYYNTYLGAGTPEKYIALVRQNLGINWS